MKYRILTDEELGAFEEDFKHFLIANGVMAEEWATMNTDDPGKALEMVGLFSDTVLQKVYEKIRFLEHRSKSACLVFKTNPREIELISIHSTHETADMSTPESIHEALVSQSHNLTIFKTQKPYSKEREMEIHEMIGSGCVPSSEAFWISLEKSMA